MQTKKLSRILGAVASAALIAAALAACSGTSSTSASGSSSGKCTTGAFTLGVVPKTGTDPYFVTARAAMEKAAKADGSKIIYEQPTESTGAAQIPFIQDLIAKHVNAIAISGSDVDSSEAALKQAKAQGIKVLSFDSDVAPDARSVFVNQVDTNVVGAALIKSMANLLNDQGEFAIESSTQTSTNQNAWIASIKSALTSNPAYSKLKLVDVVYGQEDKTVSATVAKQLVETYPNLAGIIIPDGLSYAPAAAALQQVGAFGRIKLTGLAPSSGITDYLKTGNAQDIWWNVGHLGTLTYDAAKALVSCKITGKAGDTVKTSSLGTYTVGKDGVIILGPATVVSKDNVNQFPF